MTDSNPGESATFNHTGELNMDNFFHQSNLIEGYDDPRFDEQLLYAWGNLDGIRLDGLNHAYILGTQNLVTLLQDDLMSNERGYYRTHGVVVGGRSTPAWQMVKGLMDNWLLDLPEADPVKHHVRFEKIHPFADGNGRTGRLLLWWHQKQLRQPLTEITYKERDAYYEWFR